MALNRQSNAPVALRGSVAASLPLLMLYLCFAYALLTRLLRGSVAASLPALTRLLGHALHTPHLVILGSRKATRGKQ